MMIFRLPTAFLFLFLFCNADLQNEFFSMQYSDLDNKPFSFSELKSNKATVIVFLLSDCPASQSYSVTLNELANRYKSNHIGFFGVFPGTFSSDAEMKEFRDTYKITFPLLKDPNMTLANYLHATVAPGCFLIDSTGEVVYQGRIDDWLYALGKKRQVITKHDLDDAIQSVIHNKPVAIKKTIPIGCILEYEAR